MPPPGCDSEAEGCLDSGQIRDRAGLTGDALRVYPGGVGGIFVVETLSVIIQVFWYKRTRRRVFLMAPLHHHFEKKGWEEPKIVIRFWIVSMVLGLIGLATLKIR